MIRVSRRFRIWLLIGASSLAAQILTRNLAAGAWIVTRETMAQAVVTSVVQIAALELVRRFLWRRAW
jgi:hypothetical protein